MAIIDYSWYERLPNLREQVSAGGVVVRRDADQLYVAVVKEGRIPKYVLPKGTVEPGETVEETALREIAEEAGLTDLTLITKLGIRERLSYKKNHWKIVHYFLFSTEQIEGHPTDPHLPYELYWLPLETASGLFWPDQQALIDDHRDFIRHLFTPYPKPQALNADS